MTLSNRFGGFRDATEHAREGAVPI
jgi:hypothetical protein